MEILVSALEYSGNIHFQKIVEEVALLNPNVKWRGIFSATLFQPTSTPFTASYCSSHPSETSLQKKVSDNLDSTTASYSTENYRFLTGKKLGTLNLSTTELQNPPLPSNFINLQPDFDSNQFNVMGFFQILPKIVEGYKVLSRLAQLSQRVDRVLLIDSPAFNIPLARKIKELNPKIPVYYYILPKVWAWGRKRIKKVEEVTNRQFYIFPFERHYWQKGEYVGNPLLDQIPSLHPPSQFGKIAFLPGSRRNEILALMPLFRKLGKRLLQFDPSLQLELVIPPHFSSNLSLYGDLSLFNLSSNPYQTLLTSDFAYICSGTATLESSLIGTPFVLLYKAFPLDYFVAKFVVKIDYVGLANIILTREGYPNLHREFIQSFPVEKLVECYKKRDVERFRQGSQLLRQLLKSGSARNVAKKLLE